MVEDANRSGWAHQLFILHAKPDTAFVHGYLLGAIGIDESDPSLILPSKFVPGQPIFEEIARAVEWSRFTVLVVSKAAVADRWLEIGRILANTLAASGAQRLIPLLLEDTDVELTLDYLVPLEFRDRAEWDAEAAKLRRLLDRPAVPPDRLACPYPGLAPFGRQDEARFFGREDQIRTLALAFEAGNHRFCIIGPSGSGKSSLVEAGLLPRLERGSAARAPWLVRSCRATAQPSARLAETLAHEPAVSIAAAVTALLARTGRSRLVVFIDQLEELFTLAASDERAGFLGALDEVLADGRCAVIVALRADFFGSFMESGLWDMFERGRFHVTPLRSDELHRAIEKPAARVGVYLDQALVLRLVSDTAAEPGALPLLQATMLELWDALEASSGGGTASRYLTLQAYEQLADDGETTTIATALARRANAAMNHLNSAQQAVARRLLLSLVAFGEGTRHTRRQQRIASLRATEDPEVFDQVVAALVERRLLTTDHRRDAAGLDEATIDLSHEALLMAWPELRSWIETDRRDEERKRALGAKVAEWLAFGDDKLLDAVELLDAKRWLDTDGKRAGVVLGLGDLVEHSRAALDQVRRQRDDAHRLLARSYQEHGRQLLAQGRPMRALPYLVAARKVEDKRDVPRANAARKVEDERGVPRANAARKVEDKRGGTQPNAALRWLFAEAARSLPIATVVHRDAIEHAAFSHDGLRAVTASRDGTALVWDASTGAPCAQLVHPDAVLDAAFSPDDRLLVTGASDHLARVWDLASGKLRLPPLLHGNRVHIVLFSPDGSRILTASWDRTVRIWDAVSGKPIGRPIEQPANITGAQFHPDGRRFVVAGKYREARVHDVSGGDPICSLEHGDIVRSAEFSRDGTRIVTASSDRTARVWEAASGAALAKVVHGAPVGRAAFDPGGGRIVTISGDQARVWDAASGAPVSPILQHADRVVGAGFCAEGTRVVTASWDRTARIWDAVSGAPWSAPFEHAREVLSAVLGPGDQRLLTTSGDGTARTWDVRAALSEPIPLAHAGKWVTSVAFDADGERIVTAGADRTARVWNAITGDPIVQTIAHEDRVTGASFSPDGACIASISANTVTLWSTTTGERLVQLRHATSSVVASAAFHRDGAWIVTAGNDQQVKIWEAASGHLVATLAHARAVTFAVFSPDGTCIASACADGRARIWRDGEPSCLAHVDTVSHVAFCPDGRRLVTASKDQTARIWDVVTAAPCAPPIKHAEAVRRVAFSPDGTRFITLSGNTARLWDATSGKPVLDPLEHRGRVHAAGFSPDSALLAVAVDDGSVWIWDLGAGKPLAEPLVHAARVNDVAFSADGTRLATASGDAIVRLWQLTLDSRSLSAWVTLARRCPYDLLDGVLVERSLEDDSSGTVTLPAMDAGVPR